LHVSNVIFFLGDGMGDSEVTSARYLPGAEQRGEGAGEEPPDDPRARAEAGQAHRQRLDRRDHRRDPGRAQLAHLAARLPRPGGHGDRLPDGDQAAGGLGSIAEQTVDHKVDVVLGGGRARFQQTVAGGPDDGKTVEQYAQDRRGYTLIVVTADHAHTSQIVAEDSSGTGNPTGYSNNLVTADDQVMRVTYGTAGGTTPPMAPPSQQHTGSVVPIWGQGPGAAAVLGTTDHTDFFEVLGGGGGRGHRWARARAGPTDRAGPSPSGRSMPTSSVTRTARATATPTGWSTARSPALATGCAPSPSASRCCWPPRSRRRRSSSPPAAWRCWPT
jgi:alkaline phosphatase